MKRKYTIIALVMLALLAGCKSPTISDPNVITVNIAKSGDVNGDSVTASPQQGKAGEIITLNYTLANTKINNRLVFSGTAQPITQVNSAETGTRKYTIKEEDAVNNVITINAAFEHSDDPFPPDPSIITININKTGNTTGDSVTASPETGKAGEAITLTYTLGGTKINNRLVFSGTIQPIAQVNSAETGTRQYTISEEDAAESVITINAIFTHTDKQFDTIAFADTNNVTKAYGDVSFTKAVTNTGSGTGLISYESSDPNIAAVNAAGTVTIFKVGTTTITATKAADGTYEQAIAIYTLTVTKAAGSAVSVPSATSVTDTSITIRAVTVTTPAYGQTAEYAISTTASPAPTSGWQTGLTLTGLTANTNYYVFARSKENDNYHAGTAQVSAVIKTEAEDQWETIPVPRSTIVDFETIITLGSTKGGSSPTVARATDPLHSGQYSGQVSSGGYNQALVVPINLPYELYRYKSFSFRFNLVSGNTGDNLNGKSIQVYTAKSAADFKDHGFGNPKGGSNPEFADRLLGSTPAVNFDDSYKNKWTDYTITITNPGDAIKDLKGDIFVAIGINCQNAAVIMFDDLTFTMRDDFNPPPIVPLPSNPPVPASIGAVISGNYRNMFKEARKTQAEIDAKVNTAWNKLFNGTAAEKIYNEVGADMAYIYTADTDDVRSEGMSYGMMMCVQLNKKTEFDKLWKWARTYMYNETNTGNNNRGYFSWKRNTSGTGGDTAAAPDGEFYFTTALLFASARWGDGTGIFDYRRQAKQILYDMVHRDSGGLDPYSAPTMFNLTNHQPVFVPIGQSANHTDPSYHLPAFYDVWAIELQIDADKNSIAPWSSKAEMETDIDFYKKAAQASRAFFPTTVNATTGLGPDYAEFSGAPTGGNHADFRFDAWRIAMNIAMDYAWWAKDDWQKTFADKIQAFFISKGVSSYGNQWTLSGNQLDSDHSPGLVACNAVASLAATNANAWKFIENFWEIGMTTGQYRYYDGCLYMMGMLHVSGNFKAYLSSGAVQPGQPDSAISPATATFDKKTPADVSVTMTLNGNTFSGISGGSPAISSANYTLSGNTVTIKKEYLATLANGTTTLTFAFSAGSSRTIAITIKDTTSGGGDGLLIKYNFATDAIAGEYPKYSSTNISAQITTGVLRVTKSSTNYETLNFKLPFNLGTENLSNYSKIEIVLKGVSGDYTNKAFTVLVGSGNTQLANIGNSTLDTTNKTLSLSFTASNLNTYAGEIELGFQMPGNGFVYEITSIELKK